jgi:hypothetical protein
VGWWKLPSDFLWNERSAPKGVKPSATRKAVDIVQPQNRRYLLRSGIFCRRNCPAAVLALAGRPAGDGWAWEAKWEACLFLRRDADAAAARQTAGAWPRRCGGTTATFSASA